MKKFIAFFFCTALISVRANAVYPDLTPLKTYAPQLCPQCTQEQIQIFQSAIEYIEKAQNREFTKQMMGEAQAHAKKYALPKIKNSLKGLLGKFKKKDDGKPISYTRMIKQNKTDLTSVEEVRKAFKKYFLYVPSKNEEIQAAYKEKREQFIEDTTLELYITAKEMDAELKVMLSQLELIEQCLVLGDNEKCEAQGLEEYNCQKDEGTEDEMCYRRNALMVADIYDTIVKYNEYLMAMRAQYEAVRTLGQGVKPKEYSSKNKKVSSLQQYSLSSTAFAAQEVENESLVLDQLPDSEYDFKDNNKIGMPTALSGKENDIVAPSIFYEAQKHINNASDSHNLKQMLPDFKKVFDTYHDTEKMHAKYVSELQASQECVLNYLAQRYDNSSKVWLDNCLIGDKGYVCAYNPAKSLSDSTESEGIYDLICPNDWNHKCYKLAPTAYNEIGGMSGWLINLYLDAKDNLSDSSLEKDNYVIYSSDTNYPKDEYPVAGNDVSSFETLKKLVDGDKVLTDKYKEDMRTLSDLSFTIGATANDEINKDVNGTRGASKFNVATKPFPLWNDQMNFYNQYIDGKYDNISKYFKNAPLFKNILTLGLDINKTYDYKTNQSGGEGVSASVEALREEAKKAITSLLNLTDIDTDSRVAEVKNILRQEDAKLNELKKAHKQKIQELNSQRVNLYKQLHDINVQEADLNAEVEKQNSVINYAENYNDPAELGAETDKQYQTAENPNKTNEEIFNENIQEQSDKELAAEDARSAAKKELSTITANKKEIIEDIKSLELQIKRLKSDYVLAYYNAQQKYKKELEAIVPDNMERALNEAQKTIVDSIKSITVLGEAEKIVEYMRQYAIIKVTEAKEQIDQLKNNTPDSLYYAENNAKVVQIHSDMLKSITEPDIDDVIKELKLDKEAAAILAKYATTLTSVFSDICDGVSCYQADTSYFVGLVEQKLDFAAPKSAVAFSSAPMREIFKFAPEDISYIDYYAAQEFVIDFDNNVVPENQKDSLSITDEDTKVILIEDSLLDSGIKLPEIWRLALSNRPFVEKGLNLETFLNHGEAEGQALARSGIYPCLVDTKIIDVIPTSDGKLRYAELASTPAEYALSSLPQCQTIRATADGYIDTQADSTDNKIQIVPDVAFSSLGASELGNILDYKEMKLNLLGANGLMLTDAFGMMLQQKKIQYLTFRKGFLEAMRYNLNYLEKFKDSEDLNFSSEYYLYNRIFPQNNQLGDYLVRVELERISLEAEENVRNNIYSNNPDDLVIVNSLYKSFAEMGFDFDREKFDLSQEDYYQQASNVLNARKEENLRKAKELLSDTRLKNLSEEMDNRKEDLLHQIELLELDSEEIVSTNSKETLEELAERIKTEKADQAIQNKKIEEANRYMQERLNQSEAPYCAVYAN